MSRHFFLSVAIYSLLATTAACTSTAALRAPDDMDPQKNISHLSSLPGTPEPGQGAIELALIHFAIVIPSGIEPQFNPALKDRGATNWRPLDGISSVEIGPAAFASWPLLGSTLAHELEVHCRQNLFLIAAGDSLGFPTKNSAEREAYSYELQEAARFGLNKVDIDRISATLAQF